MAAKEAQDDDRLFEMAVRDVLSRKSGRKVIAWVLGFSGVDQSCFDNDPIRMAALCGRRQVGLGIKARLDGICPQMVDQMIQEAREDERRE